MAEMEILWAAGMICWNIMADSAAPEKEGFQPFSRLAVYCYIINNLYQ